MDPNTSSKPPVSNLCVCFDTQLFTCPASKLKLASGCNKSLWCNLLKYLSLTAGNLQSKYRVRSQHESKFLGFSWPWPNRLDDPVYISCNVYVEVLFFKIYFYLFSLQLAVWLMGYYLSILFSCEALTFLQIENLKNKLQQYQITFSQNSMIRILFQNLSTATAEKQKKSDQAWIIFKKKIQTLLLGYVNLSYFNHFSILFHKKKSI